MTDEASTIDSCGSIPRANGARRRACGRCVQSRDAAAWRGASEAVERAARDGTNLVPPVIAAVEARATLGEIADTLRRVFGEHREIST